MDGFHFLGLPGWQPACTSAWTFVFLAYGLMYFAYLDGFGHGGFVCQKTVGRPSLFMETEKQAKRTVSQQPYSLQR